MRKLLLLIVLALGAGAAQADNGVVYVGAGLSRDKLSDIGNSGLSFSNLDNTSWKAFAGLRPISLFAVEADYLNLGSRSSSFVSQAGICVVGGCTGTSHSDARAFAGYAVGFLPIPVPFLDVFGKAGLARWQLSGSSSVPGGALFRFSDNGTEFAWGVGTQVHVGNIGGRLEYESFNVPHTSGARVIS
ncbi:MAG: outer membrane beta-barrel protein, partial [Steroidobacteraceae bacterium]